MRYVDRESRHETPVDMITIDERSQQDPVLATVLEGRLRYLGQEPITVAGRRWRAEKFELHVPLHAPSMIWTSQQGLLLDFALEDNRNRPTEHGMKLVRYQQWGRVLSEARHLPRSRDSNLH